MNLSETRIKALLATIGVLLVANVVLAVLLLNRHDGKGRRGHDMAMARFLKNDLQFSTAQLNAYEALRAKNEDNMRQIFDRTRTLKEARLKGLGEAGFSDMAIKAAIDSAAQGQREIEQSLLAQLKSVRDICTPDQRSKFDTGIYKIFVKPKFH